MGGSGSGRETAEKRKRPTSLVEPGIRHVQILTGLYPGIVIDLDLVLCSRSKTSSNCNCIIFSIVSKDISSVKPS